ncbi:MAG: hypothetical protein PUA69_03915 [Erysipelotrichaceae bacterium]|nr:hypothetical protein [Erysipelotrichaceae bacterium]
MKFQLWFKRFKDQEESGLTVKEYCNQNNLSLKAYYYWHRKAVNYAFIQKEEVQAESLSKPVMNTVSCTNRKPAAQIHIGEAVIDINDGISDELLIRIMKAASYV